jgi:sugar/nucleoside kinase (ribokinase family)
LIIGGASIDVLHFAGRVERSIGGAGLYTALAAHRAGAHVTMFAPRPSPMPAELAPVAERIAWIGPSIPPAQLPMFEIAHYGHGKAELVNARWGAESQLTVDNLPAEKISADLVYCGPLADPARQLAYVRHFKTRGYRVAVGTYGHAVKHFRETIQQIFSEADIFFCNANEATMLLGDVDQAATLPGKLLFITRSADGATIVQGDYRTSVPSIVIQELDPTGAGDTFAGTTMALLTQGIHPILAAQQATIAAAEMVTAVGPTMLLQPPPLPAVPSDPRVHIDDVQIARVAKLIGELNEVAPFDFTGDDFPAIGEPHALDFFFASVLQQFGFWFDDGVRYSKPFTAKMNEHELKGSDFLWAAYKRWLTDDAEGLSPAKQADIPREEFAQRLTSDDGQALPAIDDHWHSAQTYGRDLRALNWTPAEIIARANASTKPLQTFSSMLDHIGGYKEDPLRKKTTLLAIILQQRPEKFLRASASETVPPIIDYHLQRSCLRMGLLDIADDHLRQALIDRALLSAQDEWAIRRAAYVAIERVQQLSGKSMGAVDWFFFGARRRCPEMTEPDCVHCPADPVCAHRTKLFQPVRRTTFY